MGINEIHRAPMLGKGGELHNLGILVSLFAIASFHFYLFCLLGGCQLVDD